MTTEKTAVVGSLARRALGFAVKSRAGKGTLSTARALRGAAKVPGAKRSRRIIKGSVIGGAVGSAGSAIKDKAQGKDISIGRAMAGGFAGAALGGVGMSPLGRRAARRSMSPVKTPKMSLKGSVKSLAKPKGVRAAVKNMAPMEKAFLGMSAYDTTKQLAEPSNKGRGAQIAGQSLGETGGLLAASQWRGTRRVKGFGRSGYKPKAGGAIGAAARTIGLIGGAAAAGGFAGKALDKTRGRVKKEAPYG